MDGAPQTTFIPRKPVADTAYARSGNKGVTRFVVFCVSVFGIVVLTAGGLYGYQYYLDTILAKTQSSLTQTLNQFDAGLIAHMHDLNSRLSIAQSVLDNHLALSQFFSFLGAATIQSVRFSSFSFSTSNNALTVTLSGQAASFSALAAQELQLNQDTSGFITKPVISGISLGSDGTVNFSLTGTILPGAVSYQQEVDGPPGSSQPSATPNQ
jgi:hypothetical protein